ncbi:hypothetical protein LI328DRAFT_143161 [Trichoderma asperelloides]|nr:hypothetical protein LI328DRAFT_143161 [Trichoderma asperelloides]
MPRLAPALDVYPTLARFQTIRPRRLFEVPIGGPSSNVSAKALQQSAIHLYHDLGVIVFAGCSVAEVRRIGDVLKEVVAWGGQGGVVARLDAWEGEVVRRRERSLKGKGELYKDLDEKRKTANGPRRLPIESFTTMGVNRVSGYTIGETRFFTVGSGNYVGGARVDYLMLKYEEEKRKKTDENAQKSTSIISVTPYWGHGKLKQRRRASDETQSAIFNEVVSKVMQPLWDLERSVWADKAEELEKRREKKKWGGDDTQMNAA